MPWVVDDKWWLGGDFLSYLIQVIFVIMSVYVVILTESRISWQMGNPGTPWGTIFGYCSWYKEIFIVSRIIPWTRNPGLWKTGGMLGTRKEASVALFLDCGCHVTSWLKLLLHWLLRHNTRHIELWARINPLSLKMLCVFHSNRTRNQEELKLLTFKIKTVWTENSPVEVQSI